MRPTLVYPTLRVKKEINWFAVKFSSDAQKA